MTLRPYWKSAVIAAVANLGVLSAALALFGWNASGGGAAARSTARFAAILFLVAFAAPGLRRWLRLPVPVALVLAYVAAQMVHFGAVALFHGVLAVEPLKVGLPQAAIILFGFLLTMAMGTTASSDSRLLRGVHTFTLYVVFLILAADYSSHPIKAMRLLAIPVFAALVLRFVPRAATNAQAVAGGR